MPFRIAVSEFTEQGVQEFLPKPDTATVVALARPAWLAAPAGRNNRDDDKQNRGFALLSFESAEAAEAAACSGAFAGLKITRKLSKRPYFQGAP